MARQLKELKSFKFKLCSNRTRAEVVFEKALLKTKGIAGEKKKCGRISFNGQKIIGFYIVDFFFRTRGLIVELDGSVHQTDFQKKHDINRTRFLESHGFKVHRFKNEDVLANPSKCIRIILEKYPILGPGEPLGNCSTAENEREIAILNSY